MFNSVFSGLTPSAVPTEEFFTLRWSGELAQDSIGYTAIE
jgi:hypothetical protein